MARRKYHEEHENHERWLVSYADFITLLFAFFVVMYAISSLNEGKYRVLSNSLTGAFSSKPVAIPALAQAASEPIVRLEPLPLIKQKVNENLRKEKGQMMRVTNDILAALDPLVRDGKVSVAQTSKGVTIEINASMLFPSGEAKLGVDAGKALAAIASVLSVDTHALQVEGHTDNVPIKNSYFPSNWELSAVRASTVARILTENGVERERVTAVGQGDKLPVGSNETPEGRTKNRRVTITVLTSIPEPVVDVAQSERVLSAQPQP